MNETEARELLRDSGALLEGHFLLSSGLHSPGYLQCALALQHPRLAERLGAAVAEKWRRSGGEVDAVASPALGGVIIGHEVGRALGVRALFTERQDGEMTLRRGFRLEPGETVLVVEDVVTTGRSTRETLEVMRDAGALPQGVACIADRGGHSDLDGLPLTALLRLDIPTYAPETCPLCASGSVAIKPGSRPG